jgi:hypothetical protein
MAAQPEPKPAPLRSGNQADESADNQKVAVIERVSETFRDHAPEGFVDWNDAFFARISNLGLAEVTSQFHSGQ